MNNLPLNRILCGNCLEVMRRFPNECIDMVIFSPPYYGLRDYGEAAKTVWNSNKNCEHEWSEDMIQKQRGHAKGATAKVWNHIMEVQGTAVNQGSFCIKCGAWKGQLGLEPSWQMYIEHMVEICQEIKRILKKTGSMYIVIGDTYASSHCGKAHKTLFQNFRRIKVEENLYNKPTLAKAVDYKPKCLMGIPWRLAFALIEEQWVLRNAIIWHKPNAMPSSVKDRLTQTYEHIFHFVKFRRYYYNLDMIREPPKTTAPLKESSNLTKHDLAIGRVGNFSYTDPLHTKAYNQKGKNPGDVVKYVQVEPRTLGGWWKADAPRTTHPFGKNPGDTWKWSEETKETSWYHNLGKLRQKMRLLGLPERNPKGRNPGDYWSVCTKPFKGAHFAVYPVEICLRPILSSCPPNGVVLDPFAGSGTTCLACELINRQKWDELDYTPNEAVKRTKWNLKWIGIEINENYVRIAEKRLEPYITQKTLLEEVSK